MQRIIVSLAAALILSMNAEVMAAGLSEPDVLDHPIALNSSGQLVVRGKTFINNKTIIGEAGEANIVSLQAPKIWFEENRVYNRGRLIVPPGNGQNSVATLVRYLAPPGLKGMAINSDSNKVTNSGSIENNH